MTAVPRLHAVTDDRVLALPDFLDRARALAVGPDVAIQLRGSLPGRALLALADALRPVTAAAGAMLVINDRLDIARLSGADGLHLPARGLPLARVRAHPDGLRLVGRSAHAAADARAALTDGADYVFLGNIWPTASHPNRPALGPAALGTVTPACVIAIGGVTAARAAEARAAGAYGVAAIRAVWDAPDPAAAAHDLLLSFTS